MLTVAATAVAQLAQLFAVLLMLLAGLAGLARRRRLQARARQAEAERAIRPLLLDLFDRDDASTDTTALRQVDPRLDRYLDTLALNLAGKLRGSDRAALVALLRERGVVARAHRELGSRGAVRRLRAVELLGTLALPESLAALTARLHDRNPDVRRAAVRAVGRIPDARGAQALLDLLDAPSRQVPDHCVTLALLRCGPVGVKPLVQTLTTTGDATATGDGTATGDRPRARLAAASVLGWMGEPSAVDALLAVLDRPDDRPDRSDRSEGRAPDPLRLAAIDALGRIGLPTASERLHRCLADTEPLDVRVAAAAALGRLGDPGSSDALAGLLGEEHRLALPAAAALNQLGPTGRARLADHADACAEARDVLRLAVAR